MMKQNARYVVAAGIVLVSLLSLGATNLFDKSTKSMRDRVEALEIENAKLQQQVADVTAKLNVLTQRINAQCGPGDAGVFNNDGVSAMGDSPDMPGLTVVRLQPENAAPVAPDPSRGKLYIENYSNTSNAVTERGAPLPGTNYVPLPDPALTMSPDSSAADDSSRPSPPVASVAPSSPPTPAPATVNPNEAAAYDEIKTLVSGGQPDQARSQMEGYLQQFPGGAHEDEVGNWLGLLFYNQRDYARAIDVLKIVSDKHYESAAAPESLYYVGLCYLELGSTKEAGDAFREVKILYPFSKAAQMAESKLASCCP